MKKPSQGSQQQCLSEAISPYQEHVWREREREREREKEREREEGGDDRRRDATE